MSDAIGALRWGVRHYALLLLACVVAVAIVIPVLVARGGSSYEASALVVAQRLDMDLTALPRYAEATFDNGEVARAVTAKFGDVGGAVVPDRVSLRAEQDSIVLRVTGHDRSAQGAADIANTAATAFTAQLNLPGEGVGAFGIHSSALPPAQPVKKVAATPTALAVGIVAGVMLGLAAISVLLIVRRPVLDAADAAQITGVPVLGTVTLPRLPKERFPAAADVGGLVPVCRRLLAMHPRVILLMDAGRSEVSRRQLCVAMAGVIGRVRPLRLVAAVDVRAAAPGSPGDGVSAPDSADSSGADERGSEITLVDGPRPLDVVAQSPSTAAVLVLERGVPERTLRSAVAEHLGGLASDRLLMLHREGRARAEHTRVLTQSPKRPAASGLGTGRG